MNLSKPWQTLFGLVFLFYLLTLVQPARAASRGTVRGRVVDPLGGSIPNASVTLLEQNKEIGRATTDQAGGFDLSLIVLAQNIRGT